MSCILTGPLKTPDPKRTELTGRCLALEEATNERLFPLRQAFRSRQPSSSLYNSRRMIFPVLVLGTSFTNWTSRGHL